MAGDKWKPGNRPNIADQSISDAEYERRRKLGLETDRVDPEGAAIERRKREEAQIEEDRKKWEGIRDLKELLESRNLLASLNVMDPVDNTIGELKALTKSRLKFVEQQFQNARAISTGNAHDDNYDAGAIERKRNYQDTMESLDQKIAEDISPEEYRALLSEKVKLEKEYRKALQVDDERWSSELDDLRQLSSLLEYYVEDGDTIEAARNNLKSTIDSQDARVAEKREKAA